MPCGVALVGGEKCAVATERRTAAVSRYLDGVRQLSPLKLEWFTAWSHAYVRIDGDVSRLYGNDDTRWNNEWTKVVVNGTTLEAALSAFLNAVRTEAKCHLPVYSDTCLGPSCNPTCLDEVRLALETGPGDGQVPAWLAVYAAFTCTFALAFVVLAVDARRRVWAWDQCLRAVFAQHDNVTLEQTVGGEGQAKVMRRTSTISARPVSPTLSSQTAISGTSANSVLSKVCLLACCDRRRREMARAVGVGAFVQEPSRTLNRSLFDWARLLRLYVPLHLRLCYSCLSLLPLSLSSCWEYPQGGGR